MGGQRDFQPAAQCRSVHGGHHQQRRLFDPLAHVRQKRFFWWFAKLPDVRTREIGTAIAVDQDRPNAIIRFGTFDPFDKADTYVIPQGIHRRVLRFQYRNISNAFISDSI